jgi:hypothetical protein
MLTNANPRTLVAWSPTKTWLVAADGRKRGGPGLTVGEVVTLVRYPGATNAVMLDGGGSTAFDAAGRVVNQPSEGRERPVSNALAVVVPVLPHKVVAAPGHRALVPRHASRPAPAAKPAARPATVAHPTSPAAKPAARPATVAHPTSPQRHTVAPVAHPGPKPKPVTRAAGRTAPPRHPADDAGSASTCPPGRRGRAGSTGAGAGPGAWYDDWQAVALVVLYLIAGAALIVFVRHELRRGGSRRG